MRVRLLGLVAVLGLVLASCGGATSEASGPSEGIQVHGDWTIDIYNEDGSLDRHVEFSNALTNGGGVFLAELLGDMTYAGTWGVEMYSADGSQPCVSSDGQPTSCWTYQPFSLLTPLEGSDLSLDLQVAVQDNQLTLSGSHDASADGQIDQVETHLYTCDQPLDAVACSEALTDTVNFTHKSLDPGDIAQVSQGQLIEVQVVLSFTSG